MKRLTYDFCIEGNHCWQIKGADNLECREVCRQQEENGCKDCPIAKAFDRLAAIEDILGNEYDLERLRELAQADREERCVVLPCKVGDTVYQVDDIRVYALEVRNLIYDAGIFAFDESTIGKTVFLTRAEAEAALRREQDGE